MGGGRRRRGFFLTVVCKKQSDINDQIGQTQRALPIRTYTSAVTGD